MDVWEGGYVKERDEPVEETEKWEQGRGGIMAPRRQ